MKLKKADLFLILIVCIVAFGGIIVYSMLGSKDAASVVIEVDGEVYGEYELNKNQEVSIQDTNILIIKDGIVRMEEADCPDQICVNHRPISKNGETIVCLPNKVVVTVTGAEDGTLDAVTN